MSIIKLKTKYEEARLRMLNVGKAKRDSGHPLYLKQWHANAIFTCKQARKEYTNKIDSLLCEGKTIDLLMKDLA